MSRLAPRPPLLAIETSTPVTRVVLIDADTGARLAGAEAIAERHSSNLLRLCVEVTASAGLEIAALGAVACGAGPGSFTGLRVGLSVAKGLAMPRELPLVVISSLEALALDMLADASLACPTTGAEQSDGPLLIPCIDAGKGQIFAAGFEVAPGGPPGPGASSVVARTAEVSVLPQELGAFIAALGFPGREVVVAGPGAARYRQLVLASLAAGGRFAEVAGPTADSVGRRAIERLARGDADDLASVVPTYGRAPDITRPKP
jgi:tRNA threonylcarbamoyl adenosine modification protein YeaZ